MTEADEGMALIEDGIKRGKDAIERCEQIIYEFMAKKARLSGEKIHEIKIR